MAWDRVLREFSLTVFGTKLTLGGGELGTARADLRQADVWLNGRLGYRVNLGYTRSDDWTRSRTAKDGSDWKQEYAPATSRPPSPKPDSLPLIGLGKVDKNALRARYAAEHQPAQVG